MGGRGGQLELNLNSASAGDVAIKVNVRQQRIQRGFTHDCPPLPQSIRVVGVTNAGEWH